MKIIGLIFTNIYNLAVSLEITMVVHMRMRRVLEGPKDLSSPPNSQGESGTVLMITYTIMIIIMNS